MKTLRKGLGTALIAGLFAAGCGDSAPTGITSIRLEAPNPYGEIPYDRTLRVDKYSIDRLKDVHTLRTGDVIATLYVTFSVGNEKEVYAEEDYEIELTEESPTDAKILANNLSRYNTVRIDPVDFDPRGDRTDRVRVVSTEHGLVYRMPVSSLRFSDFETYDVKTKQAKKNGSIDNSGVDRPWLPPDQQLERPCIPDEVYKSVCTTEPATTSTTKPASPAPAQSTPKKPAPKSAK